MSEKKKRYPCIINVILHNPKESYIECDPSASAIEKATELQNLLQDEEAKIKWLEKELESTVYGDLHLQEKENRIIDIKHERKLSQIIRWKIEEKLKEIKEK